MIPKISTAKDRYFSSIIIEVISFKLSIFFYHKTLQVQKSTKKHQTALKSIKKHLSGKK